jgi:hypothetical protein
MAGLIAARPGSRSETKTMEQKTNARDRLTVVLLPAYAPDLNPVEARGPTSRAAWRISPRPPWTGSPSRSATGSRASSTTPASSTASPPRPPRRSTHPRQNIKAERKRPDTSSAYGCFSSVRPGTRHDRRRTRLGTPRSPQASPSAAPLRRSRSGRRNRKRAVLATPGGLQRCPGDRRGCP